MITQSKPEIISENYDKPNFLPTIRSDFSEGEIFNAIIGHNPLSKIPKTGGKIQARLKKSKEKIPWDRKRAPGDDPKR